MMLPYFEALSINDLSLQKSRIDLWFFSLNELGKSEAYLDNEERSRALRFYFTHHQRRFAVARAMLRKILATYLQISAKDLIFSYKEHGKPYLVQANSIEFNLSHSADFAVLAVGQGEAMGVDLEVFSKRPYENIGLELFSQEEFGMLLRQAESLRALCFFKLWAKKEAFIKANGLGLSYPTDEFSVSPFADEELVYDKFSKIWWKIIGFMPYLACSAALCCHPSIKIFRQIQISPLTFLE